MPRNLKELKALWMYWWCIWFSFYPHLLIGPLKSSPLFIIYWRKNDAPFKASMEIPNAREFIPNAREVPLEYEYLSLFHFFSRIAENCLLRMFNPIKRNLDIYRFFPECKKLYQALDIFKDFIYNVSK